MTERGWVNYLSPSDRDRLPAGGNKSRAFGLGRSPALLVVDVYREALGTRDDADDLERWPMSCGTDAWAVVDRIGDLIDDFRRRSLPVIHVTGSEMYTRWGHQELAEREPDFTIVPEVAPRSGEVVIGKSAPSAFQGTSLAFTSSPWGSTLSSYVGKRRAVASERRSSTLRHIAIAWVLSRTAPSTGWRPRTGSTCLTWTRNTPT